MGWGEGEEECAEFEVGVSVKGGGVFRRRMSELCPFDVI